MGPSHRYDPINDSEDTKDETPANNNPARTTPWWKTSFYLLLAASAGAGASFGAVLAFAFLQSSYSPIHNAAAATTSLAANATLTTSTSPGLILPTTSVEHKEDQIDSSNDLDGEVLECGNTPEEARKKGCVYDVMMQDWVPEPCYDGLLTERFLASGNFTWYADDKGNIMPDEEMRKGNHHAAWMAAEIS